MDGRVVQVLGLEEADGGLHAHGVAERGGIEIRWEATRAIQGRWHVVPVSPGAGSDEEALVDVVMEGDVAGELDREVRRMGFGLCP